VGQQPQNNGNHQLGGKGNKKNVKSAKSSRWNSNKNSAVKMMDRQYQKTYFGCEIQTPEKGRDGVMDIYDLGLTGERLDASYSRYGFSGGKQNGSQVKRRDYSGSAKKNLNFNGNAGQHREVFGDQTQYYQNQKNCEDYNSKYLRKRAKMDMHKKQDAYPMNEQDSEPYQSSRASAIKNGGSRRNGRMELTVPQMTMMQQKQSRKNRNIKRNIGDLRTSHNTEGKKPIPLFGNAWDNLPKHSNGICLANLI
jgi:hypothetical protein